MQGKPEQRTPWRLFSEEDECRICILVSRYLPLLPVFATGARDLEGPPVTNKSDPWIHGKGAPALHCAMQQSAAYKLSGETRRITEPCSASAAAPCKDRYTTRPCPHMAVLALIMTAHHSYRTARRLPVLDKDTPQHTFATPSAPHCHAITIHLYPSLSVYTTTHRHLAFTSACGLATHTS